MPEIESFKFSSKAEGPRLAVFGGIHGNEPCGTLAIRRVIAEIGAGSVIIAKGSVTFVPVCNPRAAAQSVRFTEENLNRIFKAHERPATYEQEIANELTALVDECDALLDLHSFSARGYPFVFLDYPTDGNIRFASSLGINLAVCGWPEAYAKISREGTFSDSFSTDRYAFDAGKTGIIVECGQHESQQSVEVAYRTIKRALARFGLIAAEERAEEASLEKITLREVFIKKNEGDRLAKKWSNLESFSSGEILAYRQDSTPIKAAFDGLVLMPKEHGRVGREWFYTAA